MAQLYVYLLPVDAWKVMIDKVSNKITKVRRKDAEPDVTIRWPGLHFEVLFQCCISQNMSLVVYSGYSCNSSVAVVEER